MLAIAGQTAEPNGLNFLRKPMSSPGFRFFLFKNKKILSLKFEFKNVTGNAGHFIDFHLNLQIVFSYFRPKKIIDFSRIKRGWGEL